MSSLASERFKVIRAETSRAVSALIISLAVAFVIILFISTDPYGTFHTLLTGPLSSKRTIGLWIDDFAKLTVTGLAFSLVFLARQFSMGVQGQVYLGALGSSSPNHSRSTLSFRH